MAHNAETVENLRYEIEHIYLVSGRQITVELTGRNLKDSIIRLSTGRVPLKTPVDHSSPEICANVKLVDTPNGLTPNELEAITVAWMRHATGLGMGAWDEIPGGGALQWLCKQLPATSRTETTATWRLDDVLKQLIQKLTEKMAEFREPPQSWSSHHALLDHAYELRSNYERGGIRGELVSVFEQNAVASLWHGMRRLCVRQMPADPSDRLQTMVDVRRAVDEVVRCLELKTSTQDTVGDSDPPKFDPSQTVTLDQMAAMVRKSKRTLESWRTKDGDFPTASVEGGGGKANLWYWQDVVAYLRKRSGIVDLPDSFPA